MPAQRKMYGGIWETSMHVNPDISILFCLPSHYMGVVTYITCSILFSGDNPGVVYFLGDGT